MIFKKYHLGLRQVVMALMNWAIDVPQKLLQSDAKLLFDNQIKKEELIIKKSYIIKLQTDCRLQFGDMKKEFRVIVDH